MRELPVLRRIGDRTALLVDGRPFIILGLQWDCDSCASAEVMNPLFREARRLACNTASLLLNWRLIEPVEGSFDFAILDTMLEQAHGGARPGAGSEHLRIVLVWFGAFKNGCLNYAPGWVKADAGRFRRVRDKAARDLDNFACPNGEALRRADAAALEAVLAHLAERDRERTVILFQLENEVGMSGTVRCHCAVCEAEFVRDGWMERFGPAADEAFCAHSYARYLETQAAEIRPVYPIPLHINATLDVLARCSRPGLAKQYSGTGLGTGYLSGTPIERVFDIYRPMLKHVDFVSPDIYQHNRRDFFELCRLYSWPGRALYISEHSSGPGSRAERNVFYAIAHGAIGFDPWAIDRCHPDTAARPLVHPLDGRWSDEAYALRDSYRVIGDAMAPIAAAQGTAALQCFVQEEEERAAKLRFDDVVVEVSYNDPAGATRGLVVRTGPDELVVAGLGAGVGFCDSRSRPLPIASAERGRFDGDRWIASCPVRREGNDPCAPLHLVVPQVVRVLLVPRKGGSRAG